MNRYIYAGNDPVNANDPSGLDGSFSFPCVVGVGEGAEVVDCEVEELSTGFVTLGGHVPHWIGTYNRALEKLSNANDLLHKLFASKNMSQPCQQDLSAISDLPAMSFSTGESVPELLINTSLIPSAVDGTQWIDATHDLDPAVEMFAPGNPNFDLFESTGKTVADYFKNNSRTMASTPLPGSELNGDILFKPGYVNRLSTGQAAAFLMHEILHALGGIDAQIQKALNLPSGGGTDKISTKLFQDCFKNFKP